MAGSGLAAPSMKGRWGLQPIHVGQVSDASVAAAVWNRGTATIGCRRAGFLPRAGQWVGRLCRSEVPKLGPRHSTTVLDRVKYSRGSPEP